MTKKCVGLVGCPLFALRCQMSLTKSLTVEWKAVELLSLVYFCFICCFSNYTFVIHPSSITASPTQDRWGAGTYPSQHWARGKYTIVLFFPEKRKFSVFIIFFLFICITRTHLCDWLTQEMIHEVSKCILKSRAFSAWSVDNLRSWSKMKIKKTSWTLSTSDYEGLFQPPTKENN